MSSRTLARAILQGVAWMTGPRHAATCLVALDARSGLPGPARHACEGLLGRRQLRGRSSGAKEEPEGRATRRHRKPRTKRDRHERKVSAMQGWAAVPAPSGDPPAPSVPRRRGLLRGMLTLESPRPVLLKNVAQVTSPSLLVTNMLREQLQLMGDKPGARPALLVFCSRPGQGTPTPASDGDVLDEGVLSAGAGGWAGAGQAEEARGAAALPSPTVSRQPGSPPVEFLSATEEEFDAAAQSGNEIHLPGDRVVVHEGGARLFILGNVLGQQGQQGDTLQSTNGGDGSNRLDAIRGMLSAHNAAAESLLASPSVPVVVSAEVPARVEGEGEGEGASGEGEGAAVGGCDHLAEMGTLCEVQAVVPTPKGSWLLLVKGLERVKRVRCGTSSPLRCDAMRLPDRPAEGQSRLVTALSAEVTSQLDALRRGRPHYSNALQAAAMWGDLSRPQDLSWLAPAVLAMETKAADMQRVLEERDLVSRLRLVLEMLVKENAALTALLDVRRDMAERIFEHQRKVILREQLKSIQNQLGYEDKDSLHPAVRKLVDRLEERRGALSAEAAKVVEEELARVRSPEMQSGDFSTTLTYLDWLLSMPWKQAVPESYDLKRAQAILDDDHYGLADVKQRVLEFIAVTALRQSPSGNVLCLVGPPGVGKTSICHSVAKAMGRPYFRFSVGGLDDVSEIKGHRRTFVAAGPGKVAQALKKVGVLNPLIVIDEIDKMGATMRGDPASALLEVLDPEQNAGFLDHYLDVPLDLSKVLFMCTANVIESIPPPLLDRMEVVRLSGYLDREKAAIARTHLLPRAVREAGLAGVPVRVTGAAIDALVSDYCREAGVRSLQQHVERVMRRVALEHVRGVEADRGTYRELSWDKLMGRRGEVVVDAGDLRGYVGVKRFPSDRLFGGAPPVGVVQGLGYTAYGGTVMYLEACRVEGGPSQGSLTTTGQLGDVMKESASIAHVYARALLQEVRPGDTFFKDAQVHVHVPEGAIPKDGPSAGCAYVTALMSLALGQRVAPGLAMTGEVTITGQVLPVGGIKEKLMGALRAGLRTVLLPEGNRGDVEEAPAEVREGLDVQFVSHYRDVLKAAFPGVEATGKEQEGAADAKS